MFGWLGARSAKGVQLLAMCHQLVATGVGAGGTIAGVLGALLVMRATARGALLFAVADDPVDDGGRCSFY